MGGDNPWPWGRVWPGRARTRSQFRSAIDESTLHTLG
ncbi:hypothetical protein KEM60_00258 [Austwickia sp. TVS 96-490-7B]|nr:hypothetical protein [Austwickia sp. TVS 96-490-7B]